MSALTRLCLFLLIWPGLLHGAEPLRFAMVALENREAAIREFASLLESIETSTGRQLHLTLLDSHDKLIDAFADRQVDLAYVGPLPYVQLRQRHGETELLVRFLEADGSSMYRCVLVAFRGDAIRLTALKNRPVGLTQPLSTCGPLSVNGLLRKHAGFGLEQAKPRFLGSHEQVALAALAGEVAAGGMREAIARKYAGLGLEVLARTEPLPGFALVANRATLDAARIAQLRQSLLATPQAAYQRWGNSIRHGMTAANDSEYADLRELAKAAAVPQGRRR